jgi:transposase
MNQKQIKRLPELIEAGNSETEIAKIFNCHRNTVGFWVKRLRSMGVLLNVKKGRPRKKVQI